ncbi:MAG: mechanosensitive ion channel family protein [Phycisphaerae bacterium]|nr:mechanosensitive ion channel family protein [Phycisphaerae bacterium]
MRILELMLGSAGGGKLMEGTLRGLGVETYWQKISPLVTEYGFRVVGALLFLILALYLAGVASRGARRALERAHVEMTLALFLSRVVRGLVLILAVLTCMSIVGIPVTSFAAMLGAGGLAVGLALQGSLSNIAAGAALSITRPFRVGDLVVVASQRGIVDEIGLFTTIMHTVDNRRLIIPNGQIFGTIIENVTHHPMRRVQVPVGVAYSADIDRTREVLLGAVATVSSRVLDPEPLIVLAGFGDSSVLWEVNVWAKNEDFLAVREGTTRAIKNALDAAGIEIPFPQRVVYVKQASAGASS